MKYTGWLSPTGELIKCNEYSHLDKATQIINHLNFVPLNNEEPDDTLLRYGWVRISWMTYPDVGYNFWMPNRLTPYQYQYFNLLLQSDPPISENGMFSLYNRGIL